MIQALHQSFLNMNPMLVQALNNTNKYQVHNFLNKRLQNSQRHPKAKLSL